MALLDQPLVDKVITVVQGMVLMPLCHLEVLEEVQEAQALIRAMLEVLAAMELLLQSQDHW